MTTGIDFDAIKEGLRQSVPLVRTLGLEFEELSAERALLRLPDQPDLHNHVGGPHAGIMFALGESASGAVVIGTFADQLGRATPLAADASIRYRRVAMGEVTAEAVLGRPRGDVVADLDRGENGYFEVAVTLRDSSGQTTGDMTVNWVLRLNR